jgi:hypothetical protein
LTICALTQTVHDVLADINAQSYYPNPAYWQTNIALIIGIASSIAGTLAALAAYRFGNKAIYTTTLQQARVPDE